MAQVVPASTLEQHVLDSVLPLFPESHRDDLGATATGDMEAMWVSVVYLAALMRKSACSEGALTVPSM